MTLYAKRAYPCNMDLADYLRLGELEPRGPDDESRDASRAFYLIANLVEELHRAGVLDAKAISRIAGDSRREVEFVSEHK